MYIYGRTFIWQTDLPAWVMLGFVAGRKLSTVTTGSSAFDFCFTVLPTRPRIFRSHESAANSPQLFRDASVQINLRAWNVPLTVLSLLPPTQGELPLGINVLSVPVVILNMAVHSRSMFYLGGGSIWKMPGANICDCKANNSSIFSLEILLFTDLNNNLLFPSGVLEYKCVFYLNLYNLSYSFDRQKQ